MNPPEDIFLLGNSPDRREIDSGHPAFLCAGRLFAVDFEKEGRSYAYGRALRNSLRTKEPVRAR